LQVLAVACYELKNTSAMRQVCKQLCLKFVQSEQATKAILKKEEVTNPTGEQSKKATKVAAKHYHTILFFYMDYSHRNRKIIKVTKNAALRKKHN